MDLITFVDDILKNEEEFYDKYGIKNSFKIQEQQRFLTDFLRHLKNQGRKNAHCDRVDGGNQQKKFKDGRLKGKFL